MRALLIDVKRRGVLEVDISAYYPDCNKLIDCDTIDIVRRYIGNGKRLFDIVLDDEGKLKSNPIVSGISADFSETLVGNLLITSSTKLGEPIDLTDDDIKYIKNSIVSAQRVEDNKLLPYPVLVDFDCTPVTLASIFDEVYE